MPEGDNDRSQGQLAIQTASGAARARKKVLPPAVNTSCLNPGIGWKKRKQANALRTLRGLPRLRNIYIYSYIFSCNAHATACIRIGSRKRNENLTQKFPQVSSEKFLNAGLIDDIYQTDWMIISIRSSEHFAQGMAGMGFEWLSTRFQLSFYSIRCLLIRRDSRARMPFVLRSSNTRRGSFFLVIDRWYVSTRS